MTAVKVRTDAYRIRLQALLQIPAQATDQAIHELIKARFPADLVKTLFDSGSFSREACDKIISVRALNLRLGRHQCLSVYESDRLFRVARVTAMAEVVFGTREKAFRWLNAPKQRFLGRSPVSMLSTIVGAQLVEETLMQVTEGVAL